MKSISKITLKIFYLLLFISILAFYGYSQEHEGNASLDKKVEDFLNSHRNKWRDENVREADGKVLYALIIKNNYKKALEIGTSTGHSGIWIAWALSKTGGTLITIEINEERYNKALANFEKAGLSDYIDARLANAHDLVPQLQGPFDFVFLDADTNWYPNYAELLIPKLEVRGCFAVHNAANLGYLPGVKNFLEYIRSLPYMQTTIDRTTRYGISISYKRANN